MAFSDFDSGSDKQRHWAGSIREAAWYRHRELLLPLIETKLGATWWIAKKDALTLRNDQIHYLLRGRKEELLEPYCALDIGASIHGADWFPETNMLDHWETDCKKCDAACHAWVLNLFGSEEAMNKYRDELKKPNVTVCREHGYMGCTFIQTFRR